MAQHLINTARPAEILDRCFHSDHKLDVRFISTARPLKDDLQQPFWCRSSTKLLVLPATKKGTSTCRLTGIQCENPFTKSVYFPCDPCTVESVTVCAVDSETSVVGLFLPDRCILYLVDASAPKPKPSTCHTLSFDSPLKNRAGTALAASNVCRIYSSLGNAVAFSDVHIPFTDVTEPFSPLSSPLQLPCSRIIDIVATLQGVAVLTDTGIFITDLNLSLKCHLARPDINSIAFVTDTVLAITTPQQMFFLNVNDYLTPLSFLSLPQSSSPWTIHSSANSFFTLSSANRVVIGKMDGRSEPKALHLVNSHTVHPSNPVLFGNDLDFCYVAYNEDHKMYVISNVHFNAAHFDSHNPLPPQQIPPVGSIQIAPAPVQSDPVDPIHEEPDPQPTPRPTEVVNPGQSSPSQLPSETNRTSRELQPQPVAPLSEELLQKLNDHFEGTSNMLESLMKKMDDLGNRMSQLESKVGHIESTQSSNDVRLSEISIIREEIRSLAESVSNLRGGATPEDVVLTEFVQLVDTDDFVTLAERLITICEESPTSVLKFFDSKAFDYLKACKKIVRKPDVASTLLHKLTTILVEKRPIVQGLQCFYKELLTQTLIKLDDDDADALANKVSEDLAQFLSQPEFKEIKKELDDHNED
ncbi:hypothetical protein GEMRC1_003419 [Eukaryota sp. GEM-RC1]